MTYRKYIQNCTVKELYNYLKLLRWQTYGTDTGIHIYKIITVVIYYLLLLKVEVTICVHALYTCGYSKL